MRNMIDEANFNKIRTAQTTFRSKIDIDDNSKDSRIVNSTNSTISNNTKESRARLDPITSMFRKREIQNYSSIFN